MKSNDSAPDSTIQQIAARYFRWRMFKDRLANITVGLGGISVIFFIALIFFYLAYVVLPLFSPARIDHIATYDSPAENTAYLYIEEQAEIGAQFTAQGQVNFFQLETGNPISQHTVVSSDTTPLSFTIADPTQHLFAYGLDDGQAVIAQHIYKTSFPNDIRVITPEIAFPLGQKQVLVDEQGQGITHIALQSNEEESTIIATTADNRILITHFAKETSFLDDSISLERNSTELPSPPHSIDYILLDKNQFYVYLFANSGEVSIYDISDKTTPQFLELSRVVANDALITHVTFLTGDISLLIADNSGKVNQWSLVRNLENVYRFTKMREFIEDTVAITALTPEYNRKGFLTADTKGQLGIYHTTAERTLLFEAISDTGIKQLAIAPRANAMLLQTNQGQLQYWHVDNPHPEVSWHSLWGKVWYENYAEPQYLWQSSSASDDFEPKFSLVPITFGTIKAAFYAMLLAIPLALMGALYTAQFMAPRMRSVVKPSIEVMEALPTVILGFLAGLWLAPYVENHLPGVFAIFFFTPIGLLIAAYLWSLLPTRIRQSVPDGWEAALLLPVVIVIVWLSIALSPTAETLFFSGDMRLWLTNEMGVGFDQRNAIVVGLAMGFAVIPTIFSIAEDAVFGVPKHLVQGSLALGATQWQTMMRVVLLTASPGIFSAIMMGLGRAVGETMIVLMATGNTPVMDFSPFAGLRTLSANIAVELPESAVNSTHFRVLFLAALVLFLFTFVVNTLAEIVRQRLRKKYSTL